jgi:hypothetical protein
VNVLPEHIATGVKPEFNVGVGLTLTVTSCGFEQPFAVSVNTYFTSIGSAVVLVNVSLMFAELPLPVAGLIPVIAERVQLNTVPDVALPAL